MTPLDQVRIELEGLRLEVTSIHEKLDRLLARPQAAPTLVEGDPIVEGLLAGRRARLEREKPAELEKPVEVAPEPEPVPVVAEPDPLPTECVRCEGGLIRDTPVSSYCPVCDLTVFAPRRV